MCTLGVLFQVHPDYPLIVAANRDELYARAARPPELIDRARRVVAGVDALSGGTWLGASAAGRVVGVTNQRAARSRDPDARSRGLAVAEALSADDAFAYAAALDARAYTSMNLLIGDAGRLEVWYLRHDGGHEVERLGPGVHVLCNNRLRTPGFPRGLRLAAALTEVATAPWPVLRARVTAALADHARADAPADPGLPPELAAALTSLCIHSPFYGTRSSTLLAVGPDGVAHFDYTAGPPCTSPWQDALPRFASD